MDAWSAHVRQAEAHVARSLCALWVQATVYVLCCVFDESPSTMKAVRDHSCMLSGCFRDFVCNVISSPGLGPNCRGPVVLRAPVGPLS